MPSHGEEIRILWPAGLALPDSLDADLALVEQHLGARWIESRLTEARQRPGHLAPLARIVDLAAKLPVITALPRGKVILKKLRRDNGSAFAEATAIHALSQYPRAIIELFPPVLVDGVRKEPDFRVR